MLRRTRSYVRRTRRGNLVSVTVEHYLRDDIPCCFRGCTLCQQDNEEARLCFDGLVGERRDIVVLDTNVVLQQIDVLEQATLLRNVVVPTTVMNEVRNQKPAVYARVLAIVRDRERRWISFANEHRRQVYVGEREPGESANDRNDRAIVASAAWYHTHLRVDQDITDARVVLLSNDAACRRRVPPGVTAIAFADYAADVFADQPALLDRVSNAAAAAAAPAGDAAETYPEYLGDEDVRQGLRNGTLFQGVLRVSQYNYLQANVLPQGQRGAGNAADADVPDDAAIHVHGRVAQNRAVHGDVVVVRVLPREQWRHSNRILLADDPAADPDDDDDVAAGAAADRDADGIASSAADAQPPPRCGQVVAVLRRNWRPYAGCLQEPRGGATTGSYMFLPMDSRIPRIRIHTSQYAAMARKRIVVVLDSWARTWRHPHGHWVQTLGDVGDRDTESQALLIEHEVPAYVFPPAVMACLPGADWSIPAEERARRADLTHLRVCSIDPPSCRDIDDALHHRSLPDGGCEVGVHIADVSYFVRPNTALDREAALRGTAVYLVERRIDMLPVLLSEKLCSLTSTSEHLAFSVIWTMDAAGNVTDTKFCKSIIHPVASLSYGEAQARIDDAHDTTQLTLDIRALNAIAKRLRAARVANGALNLASPEVRFEMDDKLGNPIDVQLYQLKEANALVEEFMLLANIAVARKIYEAYPAAAVLRRHPPASPSGLASLTRAAASVGVALHTDSSLALAQSLDAASLPGHPYFNKLLRIMATRSMQQAQYFCSGSVAERAEFLHYGLATDIYTHFTSPIRRYADLLVHRLLAVAIGVESISTYDTHATPAISAQCNILNTRHRAAQFAGRGSADLHTLIFFKDRVVHEEAAVMRVMRNGVIVLVPRYGIEGVVYIQDAVLDDAAQTVTRPSDGEVFHLFDRLSIEISVDESTWHRPKLTLRLLGRVADGAADPTSQLFRAGDPAPASSPHPITGAKRRAIPDATAAAAALAVAPARKKPRKRKSKV